MSHGHIELDELRALLAKHFESYRAKHRERAARTGPRDEVELETHEQFIELHEGGRLKAGWNELAFDEYLIEKRIRVEKDTSDYLDLRADHAERSVAHRRYVVEHDRSLKAGSSVPPSSVVATAAQSAAKSGVMLSALATEYSNFNTKQRLWTAVTAKERDRHFDLLLELLGGNRLASDVETGDARRVRNMLLDMPSNRNKKQATKDLAVEQQVQVAGAPTMQTRTIKKHLQTYHALFAWGAREGRIPANPFDGITVVVNAKTLQGRERLAFSDEQLALMVEPLRREWAKGSYKDYQRWGTLIGMFTGARLNEICQLEPRDVRQEDGIWCLDLNDEGEGKSLKSVASRRVVPIHSFLIDQGLLDFVAQARAAGTERLFSELTYDPKNKWGRALSRWFNERFLVELGIKSRQLAFHSLRHTMVNRLLNAGVEEAIVKALVGHKAEGVTQATYNRGGYSIAKKKEALERFAPPAATSS